MIASDSSQLSPLMLASLEGNLSVMQALLREGCDVDATTKFEIPEAHVNGTNTALSLAAQISTPEAVQLLLQAPSHPSFWHRLKIGAFIIRIGFGGYFIL